MLHLKLTFFVLLNLYSNLELVFVDGAIFVLIPELLELDVAQLPVSRVLRLPEYVRHVLLQVQLPVLVL
jgi:hypothetical protein